MRSCANLQNGSKSGKLQNLIRSSIECIWQLNVLYSNVQRLSRPIPSFNYAYLVVDTPPAYRSISTTSTEGESNTVNRIVPACCSCTLLLHSRLLDLELLRRKHFHADKCICVWMWTTTENPDTRHQRYHKLLLIVFDLFLTSFYYSHVSTIKRRHDFLHDLFDLFIS